MAPKSKYLNVTRIWGFVLISRKQTTSAEMISVEFPELKIPTLWGSLHPLHIPVSHPCPAVKLCTLAVLSASVSKQSQVQLEPRCLLLFPVKFCCYICSSVQESQGNWLTITRAIEIWTQAASSKFLSCQGGKTRFIFKHWERPSTSGYKWCAVKILNFNLGFLSCL